MILKIICSELLHKLLRFTGDISKINVSLVAIIGVLEETGAYKKKHK